MRILVIREDRLGDVVVSTPAFRGLKQVIPESRITAMVRASFREILANNPHVDDIICLDDNATRWHWLTKIALQIRRRRFDAAIVLRRRGVLPAFVCKLAGVPVRAGNLYRIYERLGLLTHNLATHPANHGWHEVEHVLNVAGQIVGTPLPVSPPTVPIPAEAEGHLAQLLRGKGIAGDQYVVVHLGTGGSARQWHAEGYAQFVRDFYRTTSCKVLLSGTARERPLAHEICKMAGVGCGSLAGETTITTLAALLRSAHLYVGGDTGAMHIAAAVGTPCVIVYPMSNYEIRLQRYRPWGVEYSVIPPQSFCKGCTTIKCHRKGIKCQNSISSQQLLARAVEMLAHQSFGLAD